jgi:hypothetical protein
MLRNLWYGVGQLYSVGVRYEAGGLSMMLAALAMHAVGRFSRASAEEVPQGS